MRKVEGYRTGGWMRYLQGDVMTTVTALQQRGRPGIASPLQTVLGFGLSFFMPAGYDYVDWRDPLPAVQAATDFTRYLLKATMARSLARSRKSPA